MTEPICGRCGEMPTGHASIDAKEHPHQPKLVGVFCV